MRMTTTALPDVPSKSIEALSDEEKAAYHELSTLSAKIRRLDESYYGGGSDADKPATPSAVAIAEVSDDEYDALARREAELCTKHPNLLALYEEESGLGKRATRFGGRVGQLYEDVVPADDVPDNDAKKKKKGTKQPKTATKKRAKRRHLQNAPMQSLDNAMDDEEAVAWLNRVRRLLMASAKDDADEVADDDDSNEEVNATTIPIEVMAEPKIDGLSLSLRYQLRESKEPSGEDVYEFVWGATRGDGTEGEDVSDAVKSAWMGAAKDGHYSVPQSLSIPTQSTDADPPDLIEVRGEVVLPQNAFEEFTKNVTASNSTARSFSNARNAASGILLRSKEPTSAEEIERTRFLRSRLEFYAYDIVASSSTDASWLLSEVGESGNEMRESLTRFGFRVPTPVVMESLDLSLGREVNESDIPNLLEYHHSLMAARDESGDPKSSKGKNIGGQADFSYHIDGVVYKLSSFADRRMCGSSSRIPRWAIAHKFPPQIAMTRLIDIDVQVGRTGALTPVAILEPVDLGGVMVARASLHNFHFARKMLLPERSLSNLEGSNQTLNRSVSVKKGVSVLVSRAGDVIPQVMKRVFDDNGEDGIIPAEYSDERICLQIPQKCPACGSPTTYDFVSAPKKKAGTRKAKKKDASDDDSDLDTAHESAARIEIKEGELNDGSDDSGQVLRCSGPQLLCQPRAVNALVYAYSRAGLDVKGLSSSKLQHLTEEGIIRFPSDLFTIFRDKDGNDTSEEKEVLSKIADLPGWGELSSQNLAESVRTVASAGVPLSRYIYSLGIPLVGTHVSQLVASAYGSADSFLEALEEASKYVEKDAAENTEEESIAAPFAALTGEGGSEKVKGIGPTALASLLAFSKEEVLVKAARDLAKDLTIHDDSSGEANTLNAGNAQQFEGMTIVFTGTLAGMSRTNAQSAVKALGAKATPNTVSKTTSLVVEGEKGGKKAKQARELGIRVIDSAEFMKLIGD